MKRAVSGIVLMLLLTSTLLSAFNIQLAKSEWAGTVYIRADGSIDPPDAPIITYDNITYTLTGNITSEADGIVVERDNIVIDGAGYTLEGTGSGTGIDLSGRTNVTVQNIQIKNFWCGICLYYSSNNTICGNTIVNNDYGVWLESSSNNSIFGNNITANNDCGVQLHSSSNNSISGNTFTYDGLAVWDSYRNVVEDNTVNGKPLVYLEGVVDQRVEDAGQVILVNCSGIRVENLNLSRTSVGVQLWKTNNTIISGNNITKNMGGILLTESSNNTISRNDITNNMEGVGLVCSSNNNTISGNNLKNNKDSIRLSDSSNNNIISGNNITNSEYGICFYGSSNNFVYHNNFIGNSEQVQSYGSENVWDDGYPSGGNYWSDYNGTDFRWGCGQDEAGSDGIGDVAYEIDAGNIDRYPLMAPFNTFDAGTWNGQECNIGVVSNSTVSNFQLNKTLKTISFNVSGVEGTAGFCRITIPNIIVQDLWHGNYTVLFNGEPWPYRNWTDTTKTYIYVNYTHSEHQITIIPDFPSAIILPLFISFSILAIMFARKRFPKSLKT